MVLVNGSTGIGTGFSSKIYSHKLEDIIDALKHKMKGKEPKILHPWFRGYAGKIEPIYNKKNIITGYSIYGKCEFIDSYKGILKVT